jgi:peptidoglycan hydrolase CwlO-like protein
VSKVRTMRCNPWNLVGRHGRLPQRTILVIVVTVGLCGFPVRAEDTGGNRGREIEEQIKNREAELDRIRNELRDKRTKATELAGREHDLQGEIERINDELEVNQELLGKLGEKKDVLLDDLSLAHKELTAAEARLASAETLLNKRLRAIYKFGRGQRMEVVLLSNTFADLAKRIYYLSVIADHDRELMSAFEDGAHRGQKGQDRGRRTGG